MNRTEILLRRKDIMSGIDGKKRTTDGTGLFREKHVDVRLLRGEIIPRPVPADLAQDGPQLAHSAALRLPHPEVGLDPRAATHRIVAQLRQSRRESPRGRPSEQLEILAVEIEVGYRLVRQITSTDEQRLARLRFE